MRVDDKRLGDGNGDWNEIGGNKMCLRCSTNEYRYCSGEALFYPVSMVVEGTALTKPFCTNAWVSECYKWEGRSWRAS